MGIKEFYAMLVESGFPVAYLSFNEDDVPEMPFVCYQELNTNNVMADDRVICIVRHMQVDLYTVTKDPEAEARLEAVFNAHDIPWDSEADPDNDERCHRIIYEMEV